MIKNFGKRILNIGKKQKAQYSSVTTYSANKGFTLIEILISISVMAVVFGVVIISSAKIQQNARNAKRISDLRTIQSVLQQYYADQNYFPYSAAGGELLSTSLTSDYHSAIPAPISVKTYMDTLPQDPNTSVPYCFKSQLSAGNSGVCDNAGQGRCHSYQLCTNLEGLTMPDPIPCTCGSVNYNTVVTPN